VKKKEEKEQDRAQLDTFLLSTNVGKRGGGGKETANKKRKYQAIT